MLTNKTKTITKLLLFFLLNIVSFSNFAQTEQDLINLAKSKGISETQINQIKSKAESLKDNTPSKVQINQETNDFKNPNLRKLTEGSRMKELDEFGNPIFEEDSIQIEEETELKKEDIIFGEDLFKDKELNFTPNLRIATPKNYVLGPGDEILIDIYGNSLDSFKPVVSPEGTIKILNLKPIYVTGLNFEDATLKITAALRNVYNGLNLPGAKTNCQISLGNIKTIGIIVAGEVNKPGNYTVSSLTTAFNALYLAGGPNKVGSYRSIHIIRNNETISTIDLYEFLNSGKMKGDRMLQDQDIVFVPTYQTRVSMIGQIKRPFLFELKINESLSDLINYAGGFKEYAYKKFITGIRKSSIELEKLNIPENQFDNFLPRSGDEFIIENILERYSNRVTISGPVYRPGTYAIDQNINSLKTLIESAEGIRDEAFLNRALLKRNYDQLNKESISFNLKDLLDGKIKDIPLMREDSLIIFDKENLQEKEVIIINGEVNNPDTLDYYSKMTLADAILLGNGFKNSASYNNIEISRRKISHGILEDFNNLVEIFNLEVSGSLDSEDSASKFFLEPYDVISVRRAPDYEIQETVTINGEVYYPGTYTLDKLENRISDILIKSGGIKPEGYIGGAKIERNNLMVGVDIQKVLTDPKSQDNLILRGGDKIIIPKYNPLVEILGAVNNPVSINYNKAYSFKDYISMAGGFDENAFKKRAYVTRVNGKSKSAKKVLFFNSYPKIYPGDQIVIPEIGENESRGLTTADVISLATTLSSVSLSIITLIRVIQ